MEIIREEILRAQQQLSRVNTDFLEFVQKKPGALKRSSYNDIINFPVGPRNKQPWPTFINRRVKEQLQEAGTGVFHLIRQIPARIFENNSQKLGAYFGFPAEYIDLQLEGVKGGHMENLIGRADFIFSAAGLKCCEFNISAGTSPERPLFEAAYLRNPIIAAFLHQYRVKTYNENLSAVFARHIYTSARKKFPPAQHPEINIAVIMPGYKKRNENEKDMAEEHFKGAYREILNRQDQPVGGTVIFADLPHLTVENDCIFCDGKRIHILLEWYHGQIPLKVLYVVLLGNAIIFNGPITTLLTNKLTLALLSEHEDSEIFTPGEREIIKAHIPWTRRIVPGSVMFAGKTFDWEDFLRSHRAKLVIKPAAELGGKGVGIGKYTPPDQWQTLVQQALNDETRNWIAQEYIETLPHMYQYGEQGYIEHEAVWGIFVFGRDYGGGFLRIVPKNEMSRGVVNAALGAQVTAIFEVDD